MPREVTCELCGSTFTCGSDGECWCSEIQLSDDALAELQREADDCVCPRCLATFAERRKE